MKARRLVILAGSIALLGPAARAAAPAAPAVAPVGAPVAAPNTAGQPNSKQPVDITADQTLEWHRNDQQYVANGHVVAVQGTSTVKADKMVADYRAKSAEKDSSTGPIYQLTGTGHVILLSQDDNQAFGDKVVYNVDTSVGVLTGAHLIAKTPDQTVTARDNFIYNSDSGQLTANGAARLVRPKEDGSGNDVITADTMSAWFLRQDAATGGPAPAAAPTPTAASSGKRHLDHMTADGHVVITTPTEIVHGLHSTYDAATKIATVIGQVRIDRGPNVMTGDRAIVNLDTNISQMIATPNSGHIVHALFYPGTADAGDPTNVSHGDTSMPAAPSAASPGDPLTAMRPATDQPPAAGGPVTAATAADPDIDTPLPSAKIGAP